MKANELMIGDWVIFNEHHNSVYQVEKIQDLRYYLRHYLGGTLSVHFDNELVRLWTLQDAKSGDVLATKSGGIFIYKELLYDKPFAYCGVDKFGVFKDCNCGNGLDWTPYLSNVTPATKEQCDLLFQKMKEAGYEWNADTKELKKIEQSELTEFEEAVKDMMNDYREAIDAHAATTEEVKERTAYMLSLIPHKAAEWSEEDEHRVKDTIYFLDTAKKHYASTIEIDACIDWLKSIKQRIKRNYDTSRNS